MNERIAWQQAWGIGVVSLGCVTANAAVAA